MPAEDEQSNEQSYDLCVVGAGIAGLNAAFVATQQLPPNATVLIIDRHDGAGGMWNTTYSYVRLHQPYRVFTAGDIAWTLDRPPGYLADRNEVTAHLRHCLAVISQRAQVDTWWGTEFCSATESSDRVQIICRDPDGRERHAVADRFINAAGFDIEANEPLALTSENVHSTTPEGLAAAGLLSPSDRAPVWVIGSGKTAADTALALLNAKPSRPVGMVTGSGTYFHNRDLTYASGLARWTTGKRPNRHFTEVADRFDGTNEVEVAAWMTKHRYAISPFDKPTSNLFGLLSEAEVAALRNGVTTAVRDHLLDVVDDDGTPVMVLRTGRRHPIEPGSWLVNCTGHFNAKPVEHEPYLSPGGRMLSINSSSMTFGFSSYAAYYLSHLFFSEKLDDAPLLALDFHDLRARAAQASAAVVSTLIMYNLSVAFELLGPRPFADCGLDFDRWYPAPRRLAGQLRFAATHRRKRAHYRAALDRFSTRTGVRCGPLATSRQPQLLQLPAP